MLGLYGGQDQGIPLADVEKMRAALAAAKQPSEIVVFPDAPHGFHADYRPSYPAEEARDAWTQCLAWFRRHGVLASNVQSTPKFGTSGNQSRYSRSS